MNLRMTVGQAACSVDILKALLLRPVFGESCRLLRVNWRKFGYAPDQSLKVILQIRDTCKASIILQQGFSTFLTMWCS